MKRTRHLTLIFILTLFTAAAYHLSLRLISQVYYQKGRQHLRDGAYAVAAGQFEKSLGYQDNDYAVWNYLGRAYHKLEQVKPTGQAFLVAQEAKKAYEKATRLNPLDAEAAFGLAREMARLEYLFSVLHPDVKSNPYEADHYFHRAIQLRPNGVGYHYALARYLHQKGNSDDLLLVVEDMARIYPPVHSHLKNENFWSPQVAAAVEKGLDRAIEERSASDEAHVALSELSGEEKNLADAISHYEKAMSDAGGEKSFGNYLHLGGLYLENGQLDDAQDCLLKGLRVAEDAEKGLKRIYEVYKSKGRLSAFHKFFQHASESLTPSPRIKILVARTLIDLSRYEESEKILNELNQEQPNAEAYYWLYKIAEGERDYDKMEILIQKATVIEPTNSKYHLLFSRLLTHRNKPDRAEREAGLAIEHAIKPSPGLFDYRASVRLKKKDFQGAIQDWESVLGLQPKNAALCFKIAQAYVNLGNRLKAIEYYQRASQLEPENKRYREKYEALAEYAE